MTRAFIFGAANAPARGLLTPTQAREFLAFRDSVSAQMSPAQRLAKALRDLNAEMTTTRKQN